MEKIREHEYLIPKRIVDRYGDNEIFLNISYDPLREFEI
jgi:hypothetical protein